MNDANLSIVSMKKSLRLSEIREYLRTEGFLEVADLSKRFGVSEFTIRRDLSELENAGYLTRTYGGAVANDSYLFEMTFEAKMAEFSEEKARIGRAAAALVGDGDTILLDSGSTTLQVAKHLRDRDITVVTNDIIVAGELAKTRNVNVVVTGGVLWKASRSLIGPQTIEFIRGLRVTTVFLGVVGVSVVSGVTCLDMIEAETKEAMVDCANTVVVLADRSKMGRNGLGPIASLDAVDLIITDRDAPQDIVERLREVVKVSLV